MDPVSVGLISVAILFSAVCFFIIKMAPKEKSFEEAYGKNAIKLLSDDSSKQKPKQKTKKNLKEKKELSGDEKRPDISETKVKVEHKDDKVTPKVDEKGSEPSGTKTIKKKPNKKSETEAEKPSAEEPAVLKVVPTQKSVPIKPKAKKSGPLSFDRLLHYLSEADMDVEVIDFVRHLNDLAQHGEKKQKDEQKIKKEINDKDREIDRLHDLLESSQTNMAKIKSLEQALADSREKHQVLENSLKPKVVECNRLTEQVSSLQKELVGVTAKLGSVPQLQQESDKLKNDVTLLSQALTAANQKIHLAELSARKAEAELKKVNSTPQQSADFDRLAAQLDDFMKKEKAQLDTIKKLQRDIDNLQSEVERRNESVGQLNKERLVLLKKVDEVKDQSGSELDNLRNDLSKWQKNYRNLEEQFSKVSAAENLAVTLRSELDVVRDSERRILAEKVKLEDNVVTLQKRLREVESEIQFNKKHLQSDANEALKKENEKYSNQISEFEQTKAEFNRKVLKMTQDLTLYETKNKNLASERDELQSQVAKIRGSSNSSSTVQRLQEELKQQRHRNEELRERNYKLHDLVKESEESFKKLLSSSQSEVKVEKETEVDDVRQIISSVAKIVGISAPSSFTSPAIQEWFKRAFHDVKVHTEKRYAQALSKNEKVAEDLQKQVDKLNEDAEEYKVAINLAYEQLENAAQLADDLQRKYESQMKEIHHKLSDHAQHFHRLSQRRGSIPSQCSEDWEVVG